MRGQQNIKIDMFHSTKINILRCTVSKTSKLICFTLL